MLSVLTRQLSARPDAQSGARAVAQGETVVRLSCGIAVQCLGCCSGRGLSHKNCRCRTSSPVDVRYPLAAAASLDFCFKFT